ncbi:serine carboxypeptidase, putative [Trichophyton verrucosum HKI 0517]|uniref:Carboxypeptidase n=1 Tax=Trichophyton verrucosum (strain HKI 0517) TaxID=663202 RepID=D4D8X7_TRIVH|nr:serine carboxypeptidase, putative [Trichophyton verrucosum HKI 0517]EFE41736.1 serine carboxypeptidase, putative [Trichophyton verrucosum HKI 0517]
MHLAILLAIISLARAAPSTKGYTVAISLPGKSAFETRRLPDAPEIPKNWAGRLDIPGTPKGNSLFFWLFSAEDKAYDDNLIIWLNGGPGCSSLVGAFLENGPLRFMGNSTMPERNPYSWAKLGHVLYIDQPVGTGFASEKVPVASNKEVISNLYSWLVSFDAIFDHILRTKKVHIVGESYAGIYIPCIASEIVKRKSELPVNLVSIAIGDGTIGLNTGMSSLGMVGFLEEYASKLRIPRDIMNAISFGDHACGFDIIRQRAKVYPPRAPFHLPGRSGSANNTEISNMLRKGVADESLGSCNIHPDTPEKIKSSIVNSTCYGHCAVFETTADYMSSQQCFSICNINYGCNFTNPTSTLEAYFSRPDVQIALNLMHPTEPLRPFQSCNPKILETLMAPANRPVPPSFEILPDLLTTHKLPVHIYQGRLDMLINHVGIEVTIQNMTWNGAQGFQDSLHFEFGRRKDKAVGLWNEERGLSYHLFFEGGHFLPADLPKEVFSYVKEVVLRQ